MLTSPHLLQVEEATYQYLDRSVGLGATSLAVDPGEVLLVSGPSGCGKSTLARCMSGLIPHLYRGQLDGRVRVDGRPTTDLALWQIAESVGMVFQNPSAQMLSSTVEGEIVFGLENLGLDPAQIHGRLTSAMEQFSLTQMRQRIPQTLSGGEQQKVALAAVMARQPPLLVLDEPLSMLDVTAATDLVEHLAWLRSEGTAVVVCEHRPEFLEVVPELHQLKLGAGRPADGPAATASTGQGPLSGVGEGRAFTLEASDLAVRLGGKDILRDLHFSADSGAVVAIVGRNGVGKTTLLRSLVGLQRHDGTVTVNGERPDLGMVFQNADLQLFNASVREEILFRLADPDMELYGQLLDALELRRYENVPPLLLSEGEKRRVALATVLMRRPRHGILLDEPALGQDSGHKELLMGLAHRLAASGQLVLLTTHDLTLAAQADRLLVLGPQVWMADGPPEEVLRDQSVWRSVGLHVPHWVLPSPGRGEGQP